MLRLALPLFLVLAVPATAQTSRQQAQQQALADREAAELRIEADMVTMNNLVEALAKNLGQMHYMRTLCYGDADQKWRDYAGRMIDLEIRDRTERTTERRAELVRAFNAGYYQEQARHSACGPGVAVDAAALAENGRHLANMLGDPYRQQ